MRLQYRNIKDQAGTLSLAFVRGLHDAFEIRSFVETGTYLGDTLAQLSNEFESLYSIELSSNYFARSSERFIGQPKIQLVNADSTSGLETVLGRLSEKRALIWLDAHYSGGDTAKGQSNTPVESELRSILARSHRSDIILIDDLRYFWRALSGFLQHEALLGYPSVRDLVGLLNSGAHRYDCFTLSDALLAIPSNLRHAYTPSALLQALTKSREGLTLETGLSAAERSIATATASELTAISEIPAYLAGQSEYGLAGHYYYWRALVRLEQGEQALARDDADVAARCGVLPNGSLLVKLLATPVVNDRTAR